MPPSWLSPAAREVWDTTAPDLSAAGLLSSWDVQLFATWCTAAALHHQASMHLAEQGAVIEVPTRNRNTGEVVGTRTVANPWHAIWKSSAAATARIGARFGFTPTDRHAMPNHKGATTP